MFVPQDSTVSPFDAVNIELVFIVRQFKSPFFSVLVPVKNIDSKNCIFHGYRRFISTYTYVRNFNKLTYCDTSNSHTFFWLDIPVPPGKHIRLILTHYYLDSLWIQFFSLMVSQYLPLRS